MAKKKPKTIKSLNDLRVLSEGENHNRGTERGTGFVERSLQAHKAGRSIVVDAAGNVVAGNHVVEGWANVADPEQIIVVPTDGTKLIVHQRIDWQPGSKEAVAAGIADNQANKLNYDPDHALIAQQVEDLGIDVGDIGFGEDELAKLAGIDAETESGDGGGKKQMTCPHCGAVFTPGEK